MPHTFRHCRPLAWAHPLVLIFLLCVLALPAFAGAGVWTNISGLRGNINALKVDANGVLYAGTDFGVFKSANDGSTWTAVNSGLGSNIQVKSLALDKRGTLYVRTVGEYVFKSTNGGGAWTWAGGNVYLKTTPAFSDAYGVYFSAYALLVDASGTLYTGTDYGLYKSGDGGDTWVYAGRGVGDYARIQALTIDASGALYVGTFAGVSKSTDGGITWTEVSRNFPAVYDETITLLAVDAGGAVYAGRSLGSLFKSANGGAWTSVPPGHVYTLIVDASGALLAGTAGGIFKSVDGGGAWTALNNGLGAVPVFSLAAGPGGVWYAGTSYGGVFKSTDAGNTWTALSRGLATSQSPYGAVIDIRALTVDASGKLYAGSYYGLFNSANGSSAWTPSKGNGPGAPREISYLTVDLSGTFYAATTVYYLTSQNASTRPVAVVFKSTDGGGTWTRTNSFGNGKLNALAVSKSGVLYAGTDGGIFRSSNGGTTWTASDSLSGKPVNALVIDASGAVYAGTGNDFSGDGVFKSIDGGDTWVAVNHGLSNKAPSVYSLAVDANGVLYAGTERDGVFKSTNGGGEWTAVGSGLVHRVSHLIVDASGTLFAGTVVGVFTSTNGNGKWTRADSSFTGYIWALTADASGTLYAATGAIGSGVFQYAPLGTPAARFTITGSAANTTTALKLSANITAAPADADNIGNLYVVANLPDIGAFSLTPSGWKPLSLSNMQAYSTPTLGTHTITLLDGSLDVSSLKGTVFYAGYGIDAGDMLKNGKFAQIYTIQ